MNDAEMARLIHLSLDAGSHMRKVIKTMIEGVAFYKDGQTYEVFSHEGDDLGTLSTVDVNYAVSYMKRAGRPVGKLEGLRGASHQPAFTFAWEGYLMYNGRRM